MNTNAPIGIFDSGIGGLTVAKAIQDVLPNEQIIYFGDTEHMPYGDRSAEHIKEYSKKIIEFLISQKVKLIVIACNSASSVAASYVRQLFWQQVEIIGVIRPVVKYIIDKNIKKLGIIATQATVQSNIYPSIFSEYKNEIDIFQLATPLLAPMIEQGFFGNKISSSVIEEYLSHPSFADKEAILLACTHYPLIKHEVSDFFAGNKIILDNALPMALEVKKYLTDKQMLASNRIAENEYYVSEYSESFTTTTSFFYGKNVNIQEIKI